MQFKTSQTQAATCDYFMVIPILRNEHWELMFLSSHLYFIELIVQIPILFRLKKIGTEHGQFVILQSPIRTSPKMLMMKLSR